MHHDVRVRQRFVDFLNAVDAQHFAGGRAGEFICAVAGADGNRQRVHAGVLHKAACVFHAGQHLVVVQFAHCTHAVFFARFTGFQIAQHADFAFHRHAAGMGKFHHFARGFHVVFISGRRFAVFQQRAVHHHGAETELNRALAHVGRRAVVLVHHHGDVRKFFHRRQNQVAQKRCAGIFARTCGGLHNHGCVHLVGRFHDGAHLFQVVHVECG